MVLTGNSCVCRSLRSKSPGRLGRVCPLCQRSAAESRNSKFKMTSLFGLLGASEMKFSDAPAGGRAGGLSPGRLGSRPFRESLACPSSCRPGSGPGPCGQSPGSAPAGQSPSGCSGRPWPCVYRPSRLSWSANTAQRQAGLRSARREPFLRPGSPRSSL